MTSAARKGRKADPHKDEAILAAAHDLFLERGYGASIDDIAAAAGVSKQTIYARYAGKHRLLAAVVHHVAEDLVSILGDGAPGAATEDALMRFGERFVGVAFDERRIAMQRLIIAEAARFPELARTYFDSGPSFVRARLAAWLERAKAAGRLAFDDSEEAASLLLGLILGADHLASLMGLHSEQDESRRRARVRRAVAAFMKLYRVSPPPGA